MIKNYYHFLRLNSANIAAELCKLMIIILCLLVFFLFLSGCSFISYSGQSPDGTVTSAWGWKWGTDSALKDFEGSVTAKDGSTRTVKLGSSDSNQSAGMAQANQFISLLAEGVTKGAIKGLKP